MKKILRWLRGVWCVITGGHHWMMDGVRWPTRDGDYDEQTWYVCRRCELKDEDNQP